MYNLRLPLMALSSLLLMGCADAPKQFDRAESTPPVVLENADPTGTEDQALAATDSADPVADATVTPETPPPSTRPRPFGFLFKRTPGETPADPEPRSDQQIEPPSDTVPTDPAAVDPAAAAQARVDAAVAAAPPVADAPEPSQRPRPFGFLFKRVPGEVEAAETAPEPATDAPPTTVAAPSAEDIAMAPPPEDKPRRLLFGARRSSGPTNSAPTKPVVGLPFGEVVKVCGLSRRQMGKEVAKSPGGSNFRLFDTDPSSIAPRPQFLTGFRDGCARQFTASLALFGSAAVHEATRYNRANKTSYSDTDKAYEKIKIRACGVKRGAFCPADKVDRLDRTAAFVTVYRDFGNTAQWLEMFLHNGSLVTYQVRGR